MKTGFYFFLAVFTFYFCSNSYSGKLRTSKIPGNNYFYFPVPEKKDTGKVNDADGNSYKTVTIGTQIWMTENLRTTCFSDGKPIAKVMNDRDWTNYNTPAYCWYNYNVSDYETYGSLYNWYTVVDSANVCPQGWHVPGKEDWEILINFLKGADIAGGKLKDSLHWVILKIDTTNISGFSALPGGSRSEDGSFYNAGKVGNWWSVNSLDEENAWYRFMQHSNTAVKRSYADKRYAFSIRCVKD